MKRSKKIKLIASLSTIATVSTAVPALVTSCTTIAPDSSIISDVNSRSIDINNIAWVKSNLFDTKVQSEIEAKVKEENHAIFNGYAGLEACVDITADVTDLNAIAIKIHRNNTVNPKYTSTGDVTWTAKYNGTTPTPTPTPTPSKITKVTYSDLQHLINNSSLVAGQQYQITDYITTVNSSTTSSPYYNKAKALSNKFDIVVTALTKTTLNEDAKVVLHENDTYFANSNLSAWNIKYSFKNDTNRFDWADEDNGKGVIYYMQDEFGNEAPYDFKNIQFFAFNQTTTGWFTFDDGNHIDASLNGLDNGVYNNKIEKWITINDGQKLNNIIFAEGFCFNNTFGSDCHDITFAFYANNNTFFNNCYEILSYQRLIANTFNSGCNNFVFTFTSETSTVTYKNNDFGSGCQYISIDAEQFEYNTINACTGDSTLYLNFGKNASGQIYSNLHDTTKKGSFQFTSVENVAAFATSTKYVNDVTTTLSTLAEYKSFANDYVIPPMIAQITALVYYDSPLIKFESLSWEMSDTELLINFHLVENSKSENWINIFEFKDTSIFDHVKYIENGEIVNEGDLYLAGAMEGVLVFWWDEWNIMLPLSLVTNFPNVTFN